jgi:hypothetical protein
MVTALRRARNLPKEKRDAVAMPGLFQGIGSERRRRKRATGWKAYRAT